MIKSRILLKQTTFQPIKFFCEKRDGYSKRKRMQIIDLHLKRVFLLDCIIKNHHQFLKISAKLHVTCHVTCQKYQFYLKMSRTSKSNGVPNKLSFPFIPVEIY